MNCKEFIRELVRHLSGSDPDVVVVEDEYGAVITLTIYGNTAAVIGKQGATIDAIRTLLKAVGYNNKHRVKLRINETD